MKELEEGYIDKSNQDKERRKIDKDKILILEEEKKLLERKLNEINGKNSNGIYIYNTIISLIIFLERYFMKLEEFNEMSYVIIKNFEAKRIDGDLINKVNKNYFCFISFFYLIF